MSCESLNRLMNLSKLYMMDALPCFWFRRMEIVEKICFISHSSGGSSSGPIGKACQWPRVLTALDDDDAVRR